MRQVAKHKKAVSLCLENLEIQLKVTGAPDPDTCHELMRLARKEKSLELEGLAHYYSARCHFARGEHERMLSHMTDAIRYLEDTDQYGELAWAYNGLAVIAHGQNNLVLAVENYLTALEYCKKHGLEQIRRTVLGNLADACCRMGDEEKAAEYYEECITSCRMEKDTDNRDEWNYFLVMGAYGYCLAAGGRWKEAEEIEKEIWEALYCRPFIRAPGMTVYLFLAVMQRHCGDAAKAEEYIDTAIEDLKQAGDSIFRSGTVLDLLQYLVKTADGSRLEAVLDFLEPQTEKEKNDGLLLQLFLCRLRHCSEKMSREKYLSYAKRFFYLQKQCEKEENKKIIQTVEMRMRLQKMQEEQLRINLQNEELLRLSQHDVLTGLPNRGYFNRRSEELYQEAFREKKTFCPVIVDVDYFKEYNDFYGHPRGDKCICRIAEVLQKAAPSDGFAARYGGDEFVMLFTGKSTEEIKGILEAVKRGVEELMLLHEKSGSRYVSVTQGGINRIPGPYNRLWDFMSFADQALYYQKLHDKGSFCLLEKFRLQEN